MITKSTIHEIMEEQIIALPAREKYTEEIDPIKEVPIDGPFQPKEKYELISPLDTSAEEIEEGKAISIRSTVFINASHQPKHVKIYTEDIDQETKNLSLYIVFDKLVNNPQTKFISYKVDFEITENEVENIRDVKTATLFLKSSNPRTSRGTVTTVKRPMKN